MGLNIAVTEVVKKENKALPFSSQINCVLLQLDALIPAGGAKIFLSSLTSKLHAVDLYRIC
ncbi:hypothetical protein ACE1CB_30015 [Aerosakkonema sp. BLCC-F2]